MDMSCIFFWEFKEMLIYYLKEKVENLSGICQWNNYVSDQVTPHPSPLLLRGMFYLIEYGHYNLDQGLGYGFKYIIS